MMIPKGMVALVNVALPFPALARLKDQLKQIGAYPDLVKRFEAALVASWFGPPVLEFIQNDSDRSNELQLTNGGDMQQTVRSLVSLFNELVQVVFSSDPMPFVIDTVTQLATMKLSPKLEQCRASGLLPAGAVIPKFNETQADLAVYAMAVADCVHHVVRAAAGEEEDEE